MNTISLVEYYLHIPFFNKIEKLNWPNRARTSLVQLFAHFFTLLLKIFGATLKKTARGSTLETRLRISLGKAI